MGTRRTSFGIAATTLAVLAAPAVGRRRLSGSPAEDAPPPVGRTAFADPEAVGPAVEGPSCVRADFAPVDAVFSQSIEVLAPGCVVEVELRAVKQQW